MKKINNLILGFFIVLIVSCSTDLSGPVDDFPNYIKINVENEPLKGATQIYLVKPDFMPNQKTNLNLNIIDTITNQEGFAEFSANLDSSNYNIVAINGVYGAFVQNVKFNSTKFDTTIKLNKMGVVSFNSKNENSVFVSIKGTPFSDSITGNGYVMLPQGEYDINYDTSSNFNNPIYINDLKVTSDTVIINNLFYPSENSNKIEFILPNNSSVTWNNMFLKTGSVDFIMWDSDSFSVKNRVSRIKSKIDDNMDSKNYVFSYFTAIEKLDSQNSELRDSIMLNGFIESWKYFLQKHNSDSIKVIVEPRLIGKLANIVVNNKDLELFDDNIINSKDVNLNESNDVLKIVDVIFSLRDNIAPNIKLGFFINDDIDSINIYSKYVNNHASIYDVAKEWSIATDLFGCEPDFVILGQLNNFIDNVNIYSNLSIEQFNIMLDYADLLKSRFNSVYFVDLPIISANKLLGSDVYNYNISRYFLNDLSLIESRGINGLWFGGFQKEDINF